ARWLLRPRSRGLCSRDLPSRYASTSETLYPTRRGEIFRREGPSPRPLSRRSVSGEMPKISAAARSVMRRSSLPCSERLVIAHSYEANLGVQEYAQNGRFSEGH